MVGNRQLVQPDTPAQLITLSVNIDDGARCRTERLPALVTVAEAMSAYERLWNAAIERGITLRGGTLEVAGRSYRVSQNGRLWDGERSVSEAEVQHGTIGEDDAMEESSLESSHTLER